MLDLLAQRLRQLDAGSAQYAADFADRLIAAALELGASDVHLQPTAGGLDVRLRVDGVLHSAGVFARGEMSDVVTRLKVLASLLTYRTDIPQEGRMLWPNSEIEMRVSTIPTLYGERAVVRVFAARNTYHRLRDLQFPDDVHNTLARLLAESSGAILITGPVGAGKTTTAYACLREIVAASLAARSILSLEDPIESAIEGVAQSQVRPEVGFDMHSGLKSLLRQDPQVLLLGEMRDAPTARAALEASLTGQLVITTFHAGSAAEAISRLVDMGIEPYILRSGVLAIINQRLVRRLCTCSREASEEEKLGLNVASARVAQGCNACSGVGYCERIPLVELLSIRGQAISRSILEGLESSALERRATDEGMRTRWSAAHDLVESGATSPEEVRRVLGFLGV